jgi:transposase
MDHYAGIDVSLEYSSICVVDATGQIVREDKIPSEAEVLIAWFGSLGYALTRIGLEAGPLSQWLYAAMKKAGLAVELLETRHVRDAFKAMPVKSDRNDARGIAQLMRLGWFRPVHCKSIGAQEIRAELTARKLVESKLRDIANSLRGILRGFGLKVGATTERSFPGRVRELVKGHPVLEAIAEALLSVHEVLLREFNGFQKRVQSAACSNVKARLLMTTPGVGPVISLTCCRRRSGAFQVVEESRLPFRVDAEEVPVGGNRPQWPNQQNRRRLSSRRPLPGRPCDTDQAGQRLPGIEELGHAPRQARRAGESQGGAGAQTGGDHASHAR